MEHRAIEYVMAFPASWFEGVEEHQRIFDSRQRREWQQVKRIKRKHWVSRLLHLGFGDAQLCERYGYNEYGLRLSRSYVNPDRNH